MQDMIMYKVGKLNLVSIPSRCFTQRRNSVCPSFEHMTVGLKKNTMSPFKRFIFLSHCTSLVDLMTPHWVIKLVIMSLSLMHSSAGASASQAQSAQ